jgi:hypothetical protein
MTPIMIKCPITGQPTDTGVSVEQVVDSLRPQAHYVLWCCPHCQLNHVWRLKDTFLAKVKAPQPDLLSLVH